MRHSYSGHEAVAEALSEAEQADIYEIKPMIPYTATDLDWRNDKSRSSIEMKDPSSRPQIADKVDNMEEYDVVYLGFPIWWYVAPTIINTFLESYDFTRKIIIPFATSGSSSLGKTEEILRALCPDTVIWQPGKLLNGRVSKDELMEWTNSLNLE
jgi:multimeric flavodoxin WrbA